MPLGEAEVESGSLSPGSSPSDEGRPDAGVDAGSSGQQPNASSCTPCSGSRPNDRVPARSLGKAGDAGDQQVGWGFTSDGTTCGFHGCRKLVDLAFAYTEPGCKTGSEAQPAQPVFFCNAAHARAGAGGKPVWPSHSEAPAVAVPLEPEAAAAPDGDQPAPCWLTHRRKPHPRAWRGGDAGEAFTRAPDERREGWD